MDAKKYLLDIGFDDSHLPELFNDDDKSYYKIVELMEAYHQSKIENLHICSCVKNTSIYCETITKCNKCHKEVKVIRA